jgi:DNA-binding transcriptional LysR family regulator
MNARVQPAAAPARLGTADLSVVLALVRAGNLAAAGALLGVDASTVFRTVQRAERALGQRLFERSRAGYRATDLGQRLASHAERIEAELDSARSAVQAEGTAVAGRVRVSTTDTVLHGLLLPALAELVDLHPQLRLEVQAGNELVNLTQRDADIAVRATRTPPPHLVGRPLGPIRVAAYARRDRVPKRRRDLDLATLPWLAVDEALPEHPSVRWRRRHLPAAAPRLVVNSVQSVLEGITAGVGVGIVPLFLVRGRDDVVALTGPLDDAETQLWLLTHPESRHLKRIATVAAHLARQVRLD